jgi:hypothetical protein
MSRVIDLAGAWGDTQSAESLEMNLGPGQLSIEEKRNAL